MNARLDVAGLLATAVLALTLAAALPSAQVYPSKPVRMIVPFTAGGMLDIVARAATYGYILLTGHIGTHAINASVYPKLGYDPIRDFAAFIRSELAKWRKVVQESGARVG